MRVVDAITFFLLLWSSPPSIMTLVNYKKPQGVSEWTDISKLSLTERNMQVRFCLKVVLKSWDWKIFGISIYKRERPLMTSHVFWPFLTYLPTLSYFITPYFGDYLPWTSLPTLISDVINVRSQMLTERPLRISELLSNKIYIFLSVRPNLLMSFHSETPCSYWCRVFPVGPPVSI